MPKEVTWVLAHVVINGLVFMERTYRGPGVNPNQIRAGLEDYIAQEGLMSFGPCTVRIMTNLTYPGADT